MRWVLSPITFSIMCFTHTKRSQHIYRNECRLSK